MRAARPALRTGPQSSGNPDSDGRLSRLTGANHRIMGIAGVGIIEAEGLVKVYRSRKSEVRALDGLDLTVPEGSVLGLLGPNGAGKTTAVRIFATLLRPDAGQATVAGYDTVREAQELRRIIGLSGQYAAVDENLTGRENLWLFGRLYQLRSKEAHARADELLEQFDLLDAADRVIKTYSGGMRRRLDLASALIGRPRLLILDEPTTGLDPRSRLAMWAIIRDLVTDGTTVLLTTQYLEEADELADAIVVVDRGKVIARGTAAELKRQVGGARIEVIARRAEDVLALKEVLARECQCDVAVDEASRRLSVAAGSRTDRLFSTFREIDAAGIAVDDIGLRHPTLDDVFLSLTGHVAEAASQAAETHMVHAGDRAGVER
jgi:ABC-2 type transport system ATP-binding protein